MTILPDPSEEQKEIVTKVLNGLSCASSVGLMVRACAGSGKTTTSLHMAKAVKKEDQRTGQQPPRQRRILLLTYNAKLKLETRNKALSLGLDDILEVHSFHAFAVRYLDRGAFTDSGILVALKKGKKPTNHAYDLLIIDEIQDMNPLYYRLVLPLVESASCVVVMGDEKQSIFDFNKADSRYLTLAPKLFSNKLWETSASLTTTYRLTEPMVEFVYRACSPKMVETHGDVRSGRVIERKRSMMPVRYVFSDPYNNKIDSILAARLRTRQYDDIFILAPSIKSPKSPLRVLANRLTKKGVPIYVPTSDEERLDEDVLRGKVVFSTFHQVKGLERKLVMVFNFDASYLQHYNKNKKYSSQDLPNVLYVAITRASEELVVVHDDGYGFLPSIDRTALQRLANEDKVELLDYSKRRTFPWTTIMREEEVEEDEEEEPLRRQPGCLLRTGVGVKIKNSETTNSMKRYGVTELVRYLPADILDRCHNLIRIVDNPEPVKTFDVLDIPYKSQQEDSSYENVSEITGVAIPAYFEWQKTGKMSIMKRMVNEFTKDAPPTRVGGEETPEMVATLLKVCTQWCSKKTGYMFKTKQIHNYDWLSPTTLKAAYHRIDQLFVNRCVEDLLFEAHYVHNVQMNHHRTIDVEIVGYMDVLDLHAKEIMEIKVVQNLETEHILQTAIYRWLAWKNGLDVEKTVLVNIMDGSIKELDFSTTESMEDLDKMVMSLIHHKLYPPTGVSDEIFLEQNKV